MPSTRCLDESFWTTVVLGRAGGQGRPRHSFGVRCAFRFTLMRVASTAVSRAQLFSSREWVDPFARLQCRSAQPVCPVPSSSDTALSPKNRHSASRNMQKVDLNRPFAYFNLQNDHSNPKRRDSNPKLWDSNAERRDSNPN